MCTTNRGSDTELGETCNTNGGSDAELGEACTKLYLCCRKRFVIGKKRSEGCDRAKAKRELALRVGGRAHAERRAERGAAL